MSSRLVIALLFTLTWAGVTGSFTIPNILFGALIGLLALWLVRDPEKTGTARIRPLKVARLGLLFIVELLKSGWRVARIVVRRDMRLEPEIIVYPLRVTRDFEITILANLITLTPGTLSVDVSSDRKRLFVHCIDVGDYDAAIADIRDGFEARIMEAFH